MMPSAGLRPTVHRWAMKLLPAPSEQLMSMQRSLAMAVGQVRLAVNPAARHRGLASGDHYRIAMRFAFHHNVARNKYGLQTSIQILQDNIDEPDKAGTILLYPNDHNDRKAKQN
ncbi:hypothetical protein BN2476_1590007 [Paraburkholderia piptadeniae]|uniref:Uncharacterized protein n=1 Tax=Paraburkholderia piptadeniae TaxID=1701573 RepID=A0A1N7SX91_9BURK|nr:hypothetical protein BN2476_1590007 [Paraburkholderia piptadeniae]